MRSVLSFVFCWIVAPGAALFVLGILWAVLEVRWRDRQARRDPS